MLCKGKCGEAEEEDKTAGGVFNFIELSAKLLSITLLSPILKIMKKKHLIDLFTELFVIFKILRKLYS